MQDRRKTSSGTWTARVAAFPAAFLQAYAEWRRTQSEFRALLNADDKMLKDVGLTHADALYLTKRNRFGSILRETLREMTAPAEQEAEDESRHECCCAARCCAAK